MGRIGRGIPVMRSPTARGSIDLRSTSESALRTYEAEIRAAAVSALHEENLRGTRAAQPLMLEVTIIGDRPRGETDRSHQLVSSAIEATRLIGRDADLATASTDANVPISRGVPAIAIGAGGRCGEAHTTAKWFENSGTSRRGARAGDHGRERGIGAVESPPFFRSRFRYEIQRNHIE